jgi:lipoprotein-releasing system permease protein
MNLALRIARRYLFAKKSTNIINLITGIAVFGLAMGTAALILVLSVFNGFEDLITSLYSNFNPDIKITPLRGKTFAMDEAALKKLRGLDGVAAISQTLEEVAFFEYDNKQDFGMLKGVDDQFATVTGIDSTVKEGQYQLRNRNVEMAVLGLGMRNKLSVNVENFITPLIVYLPKRKQTGPFETQFRKGIAYPAGTFVIPQEFDQQYVLSSLEFARELLALPDGLSSLEVHLRAGANNPQVVAQIQQIVGKDLVVKNRYAQEEAFMKLMQLEKWMSFAIVSLMLLLVAFNLIGALWMIVLEKKKDIAILKSMGALDKTVQNIFLNEGLLLSCIGVISGIVIALSIYFIQKNFGIVSIPGAFIIDSYPISIRIFDFMVVAATVLTIGLLASIPPSLRAKRISATSREE